MSRRAGGYVLLTCASAGFTTLLDNSALNLALPSLRAALSADAGQVQWMIAGYSLTFGLALIPGGRLGDVFGRRPFFVAGMAVFTAAAALAGLSGSAWLLVACRLVQGAGAGLVNGQMIGTIQDRFSGTGRARALGLYATAASIATALGPVLGGTLIAAAGPQVGWRLVVWLGVPFGAATTILAARHLPPSGPRRLTGGAGRTLLRNGGYRLGTVVAMTQFGAAMAAALTVTIFLQDGVGLSAFAAAMVMLPLALGMAATSALAGPMTRRFGRHAVTIGLTIVAVALLAGGFAALRSPHRMLPAVVTVAQLLLGAGVGLTIAPLQGETLRHVPLAVAGLGGGVLQMAQRLAAAVCVTVVSGIYLGGGRHTLADHRTAYWETSLVCAGVVAAGLLIHLGFGPTRRRAGRRGRAASEAAS